MTRAGRKRKSLEARLAGKTRPRAITVKEIAAAMPHRRGLGADSRAGYARGRLELRGVITGQHNAALDRLRTDIARAWMVSGVPKPAPEAMDIFRVVGLSTTDIDADLAARWKARWRDVRNYLISIAGLAAFGAVMRVTVYDDENVDHHLLNVGVNAVVRYYRLTNDR